MPTASFAYSPGSGRSKVDLASWTSDAGFATTPVSSDQIELPDTHTAGTDGVISGPDADITLRHIIAAIGQVEAISYQVGIGTPAVVATLTNATATSTGQNAATGTVDTDTQSGDLYVLVTENASESEATIIAGGLSQAVAGQTTQSVSLSGLDADTQYYLHYIQVTDGNSSNVVTSAAITTDAAPVVASAIFTYARGNNYTTTALVDPVEPYLFEGWSATPLEGEQLTTQTSAGTFDENGNFSTDIEAQIPAIYTELDGTTWLLEIDTTGLGETDDTTPNDFSFGSLVGQARDVLVTSDIATVLGVDSGIDVPLSITGDATSEYSISTDGGATWSLWASADTVVQLDDQVRLRHRSSSEYSTGGYDGTTETTVSIGGRVRTFISTTLADTVLPEISLVGGNQTLTLGTPWVDPGYSAQDNADGVITGTVQVTHSIDPNTENAYPVTYTVTDLSGNVFTTTRTVTYVAAVPDDQVLPTIYLEGGNITLQVGDPWNEPGYTATDNVDGNLTAQVQVTGVVNTAQAGTYTRTYQVSDAAGNTRTITRTIIVLADVSLADLAPAYRTLMVSDDGAQLAEIFYKAPRERLDFDVDLTDWIAGEADSLTEGATDLAVEVDGSGANIASSSYLAAEKRIKVWLEGGGDGQVYTISSFITTANGRRKKFIFRVVTQAIW